MRSNPIPNTCADVNTVGRHKHLIIITVQAEMHRRTGRWIPTSDIWAKLGELYDLEALDGMVGALPANPYVFASPTPIHPSSSFPARSSALFPLLALILHLHPIPIPTGSNLGFLQSS